MLPSITGSTTGTDGSRPLDSPNGGWTKESGAAPSDGSWRQPKPDDGRLRNHGRRPSDGYFRRSHRQHRHRPVGGCSVPSANDGQLGRLEDDGCRQVGDRWAHRCWQPIEICGVREDLDRRCVASEVRETIADLPPKSPSFPLILLLHRRSRPDPETNSFEVGLHVNEDSLEAVRHS